MDMRSCLVRMKKLIKVGLSQGEDIQLDFSFKWGGLSSMLLRKKYCVSMRASNLFQDLFVSCLKVSVRVGTKDKSWKRTDNASSVYVWSERLRMMFLLYWEVYVLMDLVVNLRNEDLHWFCGKMTFIDGGVDMHFSGCGGSRFLLLFSCDSAFFVAGV